MRRTSHRLLLIGVLGLALSTVYLPGAAFAEAACQQAQRWVESHRAELPQTYDEFSAYPVSMRRAIFRAATPEARSELWSTHLGQYLAGHSDLSAKQVSVIRQALDLATPELFAAVEGAPGNRRQINPVLAALDKEIRAAFEPAQASEIFAILGKPDSGANGVLIVRHASPDTSGIQCSCSSSSDWCSGNYSCYSANCDQTGGCGTLWLYTCDGLCAQFAQ